MAVEGAAAIEPPGTSSRRWLLTGVSVGLVLTMTFSVGYLTGRGHSSKQIATVTGYVGDRETSFQLRGQTQGFLLDTVSWIDADGRGHQPGETPTCLNQSGKTATMRVSWVPVIAPDGSSWDHFYRLDCRATTYLPSS